MVYPSDSANQGIVACAYLARFRIVLPFGQSVTVLKAGMSTPNVWGRLLSCEQRQDTTIHSVRCNLATLGGYGGSTANGLCAHVEGPFYLVVPQSLVYVPCCRGSISADTVERAMLDALRQEDGVIPFSEVAEQEQHTLRSTESRDVLVPESFGTTKQARGRKETFCLPQGAAFDELGVVKSIIASPREIEVCDSFERFSASATPLDHFSKAA